MWSRRLAHDVGRAGGGSARARVTDEWRERYSAKRSPHWPYSPPDLSAGQVVQSI